MEPVEVGVFQLYHAALVQSVAWIGGVVLHHHAVLVRAIDVSRAQAHLPALCTTCRTGDVIVAIDLIHVRALHTEASSERMAVLETLVPYLHRLALGGVYVGGKFGDVESVLAVYHVHPPVVIEEQSRIVKILREDGAPPRAFRTVCLAHGEVALFGSPTIRRAESDIEFAAVVTDGKLPRNHQR